MDKLYGKLPLQFIKLREKGIIRFVFTSEIVYCKADNNYTVIILNDQSKYTLCKTLKSYETILGETFFRCHKTYLINLLYVKGINKKDHTLIMKNGTELPYSRAFAGIITEKLKRVLENSTLPRN